MNEIDASQRERAAAITWSGGEKERIEAIAIALQQARKEGVEAMRNKTWEWFEQNTHGLDGIHGTLTLIATGLLLPMSRRCRSER